MKFTRRDFLKASMAMSAASAFPGIWWRARQASALELCEMGVNLVIVQLEGGNDGINMVVPKSDGTGGNRTAYATVRPAIGIPLGADLTATQVGNDPLHNGELALNPHMVGLKSLYDSGNLAVLCGVHYPNANLSHDVSETIWYRADPPLSNGSSHGWMGRTLDTMCTAQPTAVPAVDTQSELTPLFYGNTSTFAFDSLGDLSFPTSDNFGTNENTNFRDAFTAVHATAAASGTYFTHDIGNAGKTTSDKIDGYGNAEANEALATNINGLINGTGAFGVTNITQNFGLARGLRSVFAMLKTTPALGCRVFRVRIGGFDSHTDQGIYTPFSTRSLTQKVQQGFPGENHSELLHRVSSAISAFWADLKASNLHKQTVIMTFSEFGRRVEDNGSSPTDDNAGTDHGTASPMFVIGPKAGESTGPANFVGGMYGAYPELDTPNLDGDGNLVFQLDFRLMYGRIISKWLGLSSATTDSILGGNFSDTAVLSPAFLV